MHDNNLSEVKKEIEKRQAAMVKHIISETLQAINDLDASKEILQEKIRILKHDLQDFKDGRLDRVVERHTVSSIAAATSIFTIEKKESNESKSNSHWYDEYFVHATQSDRKDTINNSIVKVNTCGSYELSDGNIKYL